MGTNCSSHALPDTSNNCDTSIGSTYQIPNFCTYAGPAGKNYREEYCRLLSTAGEWGDPSNGDSCNYDDCNPYINYGFGCCNGCCGIAGNGARCKRLAFTGDPVQCCFNNYQFESQTGQTGLCFSDKDAQNTCADGQKGAPNYRAITSSDCQDSLFQYCTGTLPTDDPNSVAWLDRWNGPPNVPGKCSYALAKNILGGDAFIPPPIFGQCNIGLTGAISSEGYFWAQTVVSAAMEKYQDQGFTLGTLPGLQGYNPFQEWLYNYVCCPYPGLCQSGLNRTCQTYSAQRISLNPTLAQWCGCHLSAGEYESYSARYNIPAQCSPTCNRTGTIPIVGINGDPVPCRQSTCIIDGVTLNLINSQVGGGVNFNQVCNNCPNSDCSCVIQDTTVDIQNSVVGGNVIPVSNGCGAYTCYQSNPGLTGPNNINVPCGATGTNPYADYDQAVAEAEALAQRSSIFWTVVIIGIGLVLIFLLIFLIHPKTYQAEGGTIPRSSSSTELNDLPGNLEAGTGTSSDYISINQLPRSRATPAAALEYNSIQGSPMPMLTIDSTYQSIEDR